MPKRKITEQRYNEIKPIADNIKRGHMKTVAAALGMHQNTLARVRSSKGFKDYQAKQRVYHERSKAKLALRKVHEDKHSQPKVSELKPVEKPVRYMDIPHLQLKEMQAINRKLDKLIELWSPKSVQQNADQLIDLHDEEDHSGFFNKLFTK